MSEFDPSDVDACEGLYHENKKLKADVIALDLQKEEMANHAVRLRCCLIRYGRHDNGCDFMMIGKDLPCSCGLEANIQAVPGEVVPDKRKSETCDHDWMKIDPDSAHVIQRKCRKCGLLAV